MRRYNFRISPGTVCTNAKHAEFPSVTLHEQLPNYDSEIKLFTLPVGAVAKYCDEHVCESVCVSVCLQGYLPNYTCDLYQIFYACRLWPWISPPPAG